jgi:hypothetical protein
VINVPTYWPIPATGQSITKLFDNGFKEMIVPAPSTAGGGAWLEEWDNNAWTDTWHYRIDPVRGVLEDYDYTPTSNPKMVPGKEIIWGGEVEIGQTIQAQCETAGGPLGIGAQYGWQEVAFQALLPNFSTPGGEFENVLQLEYWQYWTSYGAAGGMLSRGAIMWLAEGLGFVQIEWTQNGVLTGASVTLQSYTPLIA